VDLCVIQTCLQQTACCRVQIGQYIVHITFFVKKTFFAKITFFAKEPFIRGICAV